MRIRPLIRGGAAGTAVTAIFLIAAVGAASADSAPKLVSKGNGSYAKGDFDGAAGYYEKASVKLPESAVVEFNMGNVLYRQEDYAGARARFEDAALKSRDLSLEAKAWYNAGNCAFREGGRQADSDLEKALEFYQESVRFYTTAIEKDPGLSDAGYNIEIARLVIKDLLDRIKKQKEQMQKQQERMKAVVDSLRAAIERQEDAAERSRELAGRGDAGSNKWNDEVKELGERQGGIEKSTADVGGKLDSLFAGEKPQPVEQARAHLDSSIVDQKSASGKLAGRKVGEAAGDQDRSLDQLKKALDKLAQGQDQNQGGQSGDKGQQPNQQKDGQEEAKDQQKKEQQAARDETARGILDEEKDNRKKRNAEAAAGYKKVDKDW